MLYSPDDELASWKEIAGYLNVAVRTAQLWERERNMPVRRLPGGRGRVSARVVDLEKWKGVSAGIESSPVEPEGASLSGPAEPVSTETERARAPKLLAALAGVALCAAVLIALAVPWRRNEPVCAHVEKDTLTASDENGRELWRKVFPFPIVESANSESAGRFTWVGDLDGDGRSEVLFAPHRMGGPPESTELICYDKRGNVRWTYRNDRRVRTADTQFSGIYGIAGFLVVPRGRARGNGVLVSTTHSIYYPSQVVLLSSGGKKVREYWHSGHLNHLQAADLSGDGAAKFYLAGINNARHAATVVVLDEEHFGGASAEPEAGHQLVGFAPSEEVARVIIPQSCLSRQVDPYNPVATFLVSRDEIVVQTIETIGPGAGVFHHLSPDFRNYRASISDSYSIEHRRELLAHRFTEAACPADSVPDIQLIRPYNR